MCTYAVTGTPFLLLYDFDDAELRKHNIVHGRADRSRLKIDGVEWRFRRTVAVGVEFGPVRDPHVEAPLCGDAGVRRWPAAVSGPPP